MNTSTSARIAAEYGVSQTNPIEDNYNFDREQVTLAELAERGGHITRLRVLTESVMGQKLADVSYIHGVLADGTPVRVQEGPDLMFAPLYGPRGLKSRLIAWAKSEGVFAKGVGLLDEGVWSVQ